MPQRKFRMFLASKNTQTTAYHRFHATRKTTDSNFVMNAGCCGNRNPLIGWRKESICCNKSDASGSGIGWGWQQVFKNVQNCCKPSQLKMVQNRARSSDVQTAANDGKPYSVSGKIDKNYNYNYRQYLKKRCMIADYDNTGGRQRSTRVTSSSQHVLEAACCTTACCTCVRKQELSGIHSSNPSNGTNGWKGVGPIIGAEYFQVQGSGHVYGTLIGATAPTGQSVTHTATFQMLDCLSTFISSGDITHIPTVGGQSRFTPQIAHAPSDQPCHPLTPPFPPTLTYKRNNWGFRKQGAVDSSLYIATKKVFANPCCAGKLETDRDATDPVTPEPPNPAAEEQIATKKEEVEVPNPPIKSKSPGEGVKNGGLAKR